MGSSEILHSKEVKILVAKWGCLTVSATHLDECYCRSGLELAYADGDCSLHLNSAPKGVSFPGVIRSAW